MTFEDSELKTTVEVQYNEHFRIGRCSLFIILKAIENTVLVKNFIPFF